ncbi:MAG TPA: restriction endonuclease [Melioribacteraceae bacterium]|nr:restriction endonuclease [Melioribacteraceae bacterium]
MAEFNIFRIIAGLKNRYQEDFLINNYIAIGFGFKYKNDYKNNISKQEIVKFIETRHPSAKAAQIRIWAAQVNMFINEAKIGDLVLMYNLQSKKYIVGTIKSDAFIDENNELALKRIVEWKSENEWITKNTLSIQLINSLGAILTLMKLMPDQIKEIIEKLEKTAEKSKIELVQDEITISLSKTDIESEARERVADKIDELDPLQFQDLVAGLLRAMGYKTFINGTGGPDGGFDIIASNDSLMLGDQRIKVEVKHRQNTQMGASDIHRLLGTLSERDKGLYISTGGYKKSARDLEKSSQKPLTLIDKERLIDLISEYYDNFDTQTKNLIPLKKIFIPE